MNYYTNNSRWISRSWFVILVCLFVCYKSFIMSNENGLKWTLPLIIGYFITYGLFGYISQCYSITASERYWNKEQEWNFEYHIKYLGISRGCFMVLMLGMLVITCKNYSTNTWQEWTIAVFYLGVVSRSFMTNLSEERCSRAILTDPNFRRIAGYLE